LISLSNLTKIGMKKVKEALIILLHHSLVTFVEVEEKLKVVIYYEIHPLLVLQRNQFPLIVNMAYHAFGETGKCIINQLLLNGRLSFAQLEHDDGSTLESCFIKMLRKRFVIKCEAKDSVTVTDQLLAEEAEMIAQQGSVITPIARSNLRKKLKEKRMAEQAEAENIGLKRKRTIKMVEMVLFLKMMIFRLTKILISMKTNPFLE
jgi:hypothetical protein